MISLMRKQTAEHIHKRSQSKRRGEYFKCEICATQFWRKPYEIKQGNNRFCSKPCYYDYQRGKTKDLSNRRVCNGSENPNWRGGKTSIHKSIRGSKAMSVWRKEVFERDDYTCRSCGNRSKSNNYLRIEAHHIKPFATFPEVRFNVDNGMTLCKKCHDKEPKGKDIYLIN